MQSKSPWNVKINRYKQNSGSDMQSEYEAFTHVQSGMWLVFCDFKPKKKSELLTC